ncbi:DUF6327 family protein [Cellulophaga sp. Hel_I_12]|uniref:DUF6327 family protein n=1 Tax=Cellulophaga sp. Hel_I_12 TaxID=1249972 RepID=UPI0006465322|nr:DUF6327 family protein [Cellulophaga sp. Hel_I_12]
MNKHYHSFEEIDERLHILKIHREIEMESLRLIYNQTKLKLQPSHVVQNLSGNIQQMVLTLVLKKMKMLFQRIKREN